MPSALEILRRERELEKKPPTEETAEETLSTKLAPRESPGEEALGRMVPGMKGSTALDIMRRARERREREGPAEFPEDVAKGAGKAALVGGAMAAGALTGNLPLSARIAAQVLTGAGIETATRVGQGESLREASGPSAVSGAIGGAAEAAIPVAGRAVGATVRGVRRGIRGARAAGRAARGAERMPERGFIESARAPFREQLEEGGEAAFETTRELGGQLTPGQVSQARVIDLAENIAESSIFGGGGLHAVRQGARRVTSEAIEEVADRYARTASRQEVGELVQNAVQGRLQRVKGVAQGFYRQADQMLEGAEVNIRPLKRAVNAARDRARGGLGNPKLERIARRVNEKGETISFAEAQQLRSDFFEVSQQFNPNREAVLRAEKAAAKRFSDVMTRQIDAAAEAADPRAREVLQQANRIWREEVRGELGDKIVTRLVRQEGEDVLDALIARGRPGDIRTLRNIVQQESPEAWRGVQGAFMKRLLANSGDEVIDTGGNRLVRVSGQRLVENLKRFGREDDAALKALFPGDDFRAIRNLRQYGNALKFAERGAGGEGSGSIFINLMQAAAFGGVAAGGATLLFGGDLRQAGEAGLGGASAGILLGPVALTRLLTNPTTARWLTVGAASAPGSRQAARAGLVLLGNLTRDRLLDEENMEKARDLMRSFKSQLGISEREEVSARGENVRGGRTIQLSPEERRRVQQSREFASQDAARTNVP